MSSTVAKLPQEILAKVFDNLSISDIKNIIESKGNNTRNIPILATTHQIQNELYDRQNPIKYLDRAFYNPRELLVGMGFHGMLLSGSRALNYFVKGTCNEDSDWDFYCHSSDECIFYSMETLKKAGVIWETAKQKLLKLARSSNRESIGSYEHIIPVEILCDENYSIYTTDNLDIINYYINAFEGDYTNMHVNVVNGTVSKNNKLHKIQLIFSKDNLNPVECILGYHSTILQCFITFGGACHMYRDDLEQRQSYYLSRNLGKLSPEIITKYNKRGITFKHQNGDIITPSTNMKNYYGSISYHTMRALLNSNEGCEHRSLRDNNSVFVSFKEYYQNDITLDNDLGIYDIILNTLTTFYYSRDIDVSSYIITAELYLKYISWYDTHYTTIISDNLIDIISSVNKVDLPVIADIYKPASLTKCENLRSSFYVKKECIYENSVKYLKEYGVKYLI